MSASGANSVFGFKRESVFGTAVVVDRFVEFLPGESLGRKNELTRSNGIRGGLNQAQLGSRRAVTGRSADGEVKFEAASKGFGQFYEMLLGGVVTAQQGGTIAYKHTFTPGSIDGKSQTLQLQLRNPDGSPSFTKTYPGSKVQSIEVSTEKGKVVEMSVGFDCRDEVTSIAPASESYLSGSHPFNFSQSALSIGGVAATNVTKASIKIENSLATDRKFIGSGGLKAEQIRDGFLKVTGKLTAEFAGAAQFYDRFVADTATALVLGWTGTQIASPYNELLQYTCADSRFTGETPQVKGLDIVMVDVPFEAVWNATDPSVQVDYITTDTTP